MDLIKPTNNALHAEYTFYYKVYALGGSTEWFGPYTIHIGCTAASNAWTDNVSFITTGKAFVTQDKYYRYEFKWPT